MNDSFYLANLNNNLGRKQQALECFAQLAKEKQELDLVDRNLLSNIVKTAVDPMRQSIKCLNETIVSERVNGHAKNVDTLTEIKNNCVQDIQKMCQQGLDLIEGSLLNSTKSIESQIHFQKIRGDLYRYIIEVNPDSESAIKNAKEAYMFAYTKSIDNLPPCSPIRLGAALNFAVFKYEQLRCNEDATEILQSALAKYKEGFNELSDPTKADVLAIVRVIQQNLSRWTIIESDEAEEEEEEEEDNNEEEDFGPAQDYDEEEDY